MSTPSVRQMAKAVLRQLAPHTYGDLMSRRSNRYARRVLERDGIPELAECYVAAHGLTVAGGPFRGMQYVEASVGSVFIPKLIGCYECELHAALEAALQIPRDVVVDIGCAEGYYGVGLALRMANDGRVFAYDTDPAARTACSRLASRNDVGSRVHVGAFCDTAELNRVIGPRSLVICDCEGYEVELLDPKLVPGLRGCDIIVELHDLARPGITATLSARFAASHRIELISALPRDAAQYPALDVLPPETRSRAVSEYRGGPQQWAVMTPAGGRAG